MRDHASGPNPLNRHFGTCPTRMWWSCVYCISRDNGGSTDVIISPKLRVLLWSHHIFSGEKKKLKYLKKKIHYLYILRGFRKLVIAFFPVKNTPKLIN